MKRSCALTSILQAPKFLHESFSIFTSSAVTEKFASIGKPKV